MCLQGGGLFLELSKRAQMTGNTVELDEAIRSLTLLHHLPPRSKVKPYLYNEGQGKWIHCVHLACLRNRDRPKSKQFPEILVRTTLTTAIDPHPSLALLRLRRWAMVPSASSLKVLRCWIP